MPQNIMCMHMHARQRRYIKVRTRIYLTQKPYGTVANQFSSRNRTVWYQAALLHNSEPRARKSRINNIDALNLRSRLAHEIRSVF